MMHFFKRNLDKTCLLSLRQINSVSTGICSILQTSVDVSIDNFTIYAHCYCTDHATMKLTRLAQCDFRVRISPIHLLTDLLEQRPDVDAGSYLQINQSYEQKLRHDTDAMCYEDYFVCCEWHECSCLL